MQLVQQPACLPTSRLPPQPVPRLTRLPLVSQRAKRGSSTLLAVAAAAASSRAATGSSSSGASRSGRGRAAAWAAWQLGWTLTYLLPSVSGGRLGGLPWTARGLPLTAGGRRLAALTAITTADRPTLTGGGRRRRAAAGGLIETWTERAARRGPTAGDRRRALAGLTTGVRPGRSGGRPIALMSGGRRRGRPSAARRRPSETSRHRGATAPHPAAGAWGREGLWRLAS